MGRKGNNTTKGVGFNKRTNKWTARGPSIRGYRAFLGYFKTEEEAVEALLKYEREKYG
jgi:hypothetical protein